MAVGYCDSEATESQRRAQAGSRAPKAPAKRVLTLDPAEHGVNVWISHRRDQSQARSSASTRCSRARTQLRPPLSLGCGADENPRKRWVTVPTAARARPVNEEAELGSKGVSKERTRTLARRLAVDCRRRDSRLAGLRNLKSPSKCGWPREGRRDW